MEKKQSLGYLKLVSHIEMESKIQGKFSVSNIDLISNQCVLCK
jgi:hypothetical protein